MAAHSNPTDETTFLVKKYARLANPDQADGASFASEGSRAISKERWIYFDADVQPIKLSISKDSLFRLQRDNVILECFSLISASEGLRVIAKGDSILVVCKAEDGSRKFRLQFCEEDGQSGVERCQRCLKLLCSYVQIKRTNPQTKGQEKESPANPGTTEDIIQRLFQSVASTATGPHESRDEAQLEEEIFRCLLDANFYPLVRQVEECLHRLL